MHALHTIYIYTTIEMNLKAKQTIEYWKQICCADYYNVINTNWVKGYFNGMLAAFPRCTSGID